MSDMTNRPDRRASRAGGIVGSIVVVSFVASLAAVSAVPGASTIPRSARPAASDPRAYSAQPKVSLEGSARRPATRPLPRAPAEAREGHRHNPRDTQRRAHPTGKLLSVSGDSRVHGTGEVRSFTVQVEQGLGIRPAAFGARVEKILFSPRGWTRGDVAFRRVAGPVADFHVILAGRGMTDRLCAPALTRGRLSCHNAGKVVINFWRWTNGARSYRGELDRYRIYVVNHEVGHALGKGHLSCPASGAPAPVMMQQTLGVGPCRARPWPAAYEIDN